MTTPLLCEECGYPVPLSANTCPHCGRPGMFPNVKAAKVSTEVDALNKRYKTAQVDAANRGISDVLKDFEDAALTSHAVIARPFDEVFRLASGDNQLYATYYGLLEGGIKLPTGEKWDKLRALTDDAMFPNYKEQIRFASLSLDEIGLSNYGECSIVLRDDMIEHRATVFEENSVMFMKKHDIKIWEAVNLPLGYRATWLSRNRLCVAKLYRQLDVDTQPDQYLGIILKQGTTSEEDEFVEVHIYGTMTVRTIKKVTLTSRPKGNGRIRALKAKLDKFGVSFVEK